MRSSGRRPFLWIALALITILGAGCATYGAGVQPMLDRLQAGDPQGALAHLEKRPREGDALYQLERGMLLRLAGRFRESNAAFDAADRITEDLYTRSVSRQTVALAVTDRLAPYRPAVYERLLTHQYQARNYLDIADLAGALVEARRMEALLDQFEDARGDRSRPYGSELAYLTSAVIYEAGGQPEDALRMYRRLAARPQESVLPAWAETRMRRLARQTGFDLSHGGGADSSATRSAAEDSSTFTVVLFIDRGLVPLRQEARLDVPILKSEEHDKPETIAPKIGERIGGIRAHELDFSGAEIAYWLAIALPFYSAAPPDPGPIRIDAEGVGVDATRTADIFGMAACALEDDMPGIVLRTVLRALIKYGAQHAAEKHGGELGGILANMLGAATEQAETRAWATLPRDIVMIALDLPRPVRSVQLTPRGSDGLEGAQAIPLVFPAGSRFAFASRRIWP